MAWRAEPPREIADSFLPAPPPLLAPYLIESEEWRLNGPPEDGAEAMPGAFRTYRLFMDHAERATLEIEWQGQAGALAIQVSRRGRMVCESYPKPGAARLDLAPYLAEPGEFFVRIAAAAGGTGAVVRSARFVFELDHGTRWKSWLFFAALSAAVWSALVGGLWPRRRPRWRSQWRRMARRPARIALALGLAGALILLAANGLWRTQKDFDDVYAIGAAGALARHGFDADRLFFRARSRPAFAAALAPLQAILPLRFASTSKWNTDDWKRWFDKYDRPGVAFARFAYKEHSALALAALFGAIALAGRLFRVARLGRAPWLAAMIALAISIGHILDNVIVFSFETAAIWAALAAIVWAGRRESAAAMAAAGLACGAAALAKETALAIAPPAVFALAAHVYRSSSRWHGLRRAALCAALAAALPSIYFGAIVPEGFGALRELRENHAFQMQLYPRSFPPLDAQRAAAALWGFGGIFLLSGAAGALAVSIRMARFRVAPFWPLFFAAWALGAFAPLLSPFALPRFFIHLGPPMAYFTGKLFECAFRAPAKQQPAGERLII